MNTGYRQSTEAVALRCTRYFFDKSKNELEIVTFGIDIIAREEERKILKIRIQGYNNGNQIIDTMFTFHSIYNDELPPTGSILDINTYQINLIN